MKKVNVFIDTNIYLRFYDSKQSNFKKLLKSVEEIHQYVFITKQIVDEIDRNKQDLFKRSFEEYLFQSSVKKVEIPEHISTSTDKEIQNWNKERVDLEIKMKSQNEKLRKIAEKVLMEILNGDDEISKLISTLSANISDTTEEQIENARLKKELGNPPGKKDDPLGDQLNWIQLMDDIEGVEDLIIISADNDFFNIHNEVIHLNAKLYKEIVEKNGKIDIHCFKTLSEGLKKFDEIKAIKNLPDSSVLEQIKKEEAQDFIRTIRSSNLLAQPFNTYSDHNSSFLQQPPRYPFTAPLMCPSCGEMTLFSKAIKLPNHRYGRIYECNLCGFTRQEADD